MYFNSLHFIIFLTAVLALTWPLRRAVPVRNFLLLVASYYFYGCWDWRFLSLIVFSTLERLLYGGGNFSGIKTLLLVALYFLLDWLLRQALEFAFGLAKRPEQIGDAIAHAGAKLHAPAEETEAETLQAAADAPLPDETQLRAATPAAWPAIIKSFKQP